jgi:two-component system response regulator AlgR
MPVRILLVDDDYALRQLAREVLDIELAAAVHEITDAATGAEALIRCTRQRVDLVVLDMHMPGIDGLSLLGYLGELRHRPRIVAWSHDELALRRASMHGADFVVNKHDGLEKLTAAVHQCIAAREAG